MSSVKVTIARDSVMLYSSTMSVNEEEVEPADANTYRPFKVMDSAIMKNIAAEIEALGEPENEGVYAGNIGLVFSPKPSNRTHRFCGSPDESDLL